MNLASLVLAGILSGHALAGERLADGRYSESSRLERFKERVEFSRRLSLERADELVVVADWNRFSYPSQLATWERDLSVVAAPEGAAFVRIRFLQGDAQIDLEIDRYATIGEATQRFLARASGVNTVDILDEAGPPDLGTLSATRKALDGQILYWTYRNTFIYLSSFQTRIDLLPLARAIQQALIANTQRNASSVPANQTRPAPSADRQ